MWCSFAIPSFFVFLPFVALSVKVETPHSFGEEFFREFEQEAFNQQENIRNESITDSRIGVDFRCIGCTIGMSLLLDLHKKGSAPNTYLKAATFLCGATGIESKVSQAHCAKIQTHSG